MLDAAVRIFADSGYHGASMIAIAEAAGVTKPMVYNYFGSKQGLYLACITRSGELLRQMLSDAGQGETDPEQVLWKRLRAFFDYVGEHRDEWRVLDMEAKSSGGPFSEGVREARAELIGQVLSQLAETDSLDTPPAELEALAHALVGAGEALTDWWLEHPGEPAEAMALRLMNFVWLGLQGLTAGERWTPTRLAAG